MTASPLARRTNRLLMPKLGLTMTEGLLLEWHVSAGDTFRTGQILCVVETDKVANEVEAPSDGEIEEILVAEGEIIGPGTPLALWAGSGSANAEQAPGNEQEASVSEAPAAAAVTAATGSPGPAVAVMALPSTKSSERLVATPYARRLARQANVDLEQVSGSGPDGRIKADDVIAAKTAPCPARAASPASGDRLVDLSSVQRAMAQRMVDAVREIPHFYLTANVVADPLLRMRQAVNAEGAPLHLTIGHFVVAAMAKALASEPGDNRIWDQGRYRVFGAVDIGIAVAAPAGLLAPVLRDVGSMDLMDLAQAHDRLVARARDSQLAVDDMHGGAVTISNLGAHGVGQVFPIINPPQSLILGVGATHAHLVQSADGEIEPQSLLPIVLAADHRVFDGASAAGVLRRVTDGLQQPQTLLES